MKMRRLGRGIDFDDEEPDLVEVYFCFVFGRTILKGQKETNAPGQEKNSSFTEHASPLMGFYTVESVLRKMTSPQR